MLAVALGTLGCGNDELLAPSRAAPPAAHEEALPQALPPPGVHIRGVVLILTDDQGYDLSLPAVGRRGVSTPAMDALARRGVFFTRAFAAAASCSPSRAAILTGRAPHANGQWCNTSDILLSEPDIEFTRQTSQYDGRVGVHDDVVTLVELLRDHGLHTGITQKHHVAPPWKFQFESRMREAGWDPAAFSRAVGAFIDESAGRPFFLMANVSHPHRPFKPEIAGVTAPDPDDLDVPAWLPDTPTVREDLARYHAAVGAADRCVDAIVQALAERGATDDTLIVFTGDQGPGFHRAKASAYPAGLHVPLAIAGPGVQAGRTWSGAASHLDLAPTILASLRLPIPAAMQGRSLWSVLSGRAPDEPEPRVVYASQNAHGVATGSHYPSRVATDGNHYLIWNLMPGKAQVLPEDLRLFEHWENPTYDETVRAAGGPHDESFQILRALEQGAQPEFELYALDTDRDAMVNRATDRDSQTILQDLFGRLVAWRRDTGDIDRDPAEFIRRSFVLAPSATTLSDFNDPWRVQLRDLGDTSVTDGALRGVVSGREPAISLTPPAVIRADQTPYLEVTIDVPVGTEVRLLFQRSTDSTFDLERSLRCYARAPSERLLYEVGEHALWSGEIVALRVVPVADVAVPIELRHVRAGDELRVDPPPR